MKLMVFVLLVASGCWAQQMDERNDPALQLRFYIPQRISISNEQGRAGKVNTEWVVLPYIVERFDHTSKWMGLVVKLAGSKQVLTTGAGGLMFTVDGKQLMVSPALLAHSHKEESCAQFRCTAMWSLQPRMAAEGAGLVMLARAVADGHEVYATVFPGDSDGGQRFTVQLTDAQLSAFHDVQQYYDSLALAKKIPE